MFASISSAVLIGAAGQPITVEVHVGQGIPGFTIVGLPDESIREARDRVRAAVMSSGQDWPRHRITIGLAPSQERKTGSGLDLAIAVGVLVATEVITPEAVDGLAFIGELGLDGSIRPVRGVAPMVGTLGAADVVVPVGSAVEARVAALGRVRLVRQLDELVGVLAHQLPWPDHEPPPRPPETTATPDMAEVHGQPLARLALEIAAAGGHHTLFVGPPGSGKTMLASRLPGLLPALERDRALEATMIHSAAGVSLPPSGLVERPPFRAPHHTSSMVSVIGGGSNHPRPGAVSLAHCGVLFLDEIAEFPAMVLDSLRQPLEEGVVRVGRAKVNVDLPADFLLVAAMNPCPCGGGGGPGDCVCADAALQRYARRLSGPLVDRFDLRVGVTRPAIDELLAIEPNESTEVVAARVAVARSTATHRQGGLNRSIRVRDLDEVAPLEPAARAVLRRELEFERLSGRGYHRVRRVARTIADLRDAGDEPVAESDVALALELRTGLRGAFRSGRAA
ncbi:MAG: YifB family Mg chelatase-like AAA ATPase [Ilumatobacteraceae bacterium]